jgi:hypothetical protein
MDLERTWYINIETVPPLGAVPNPDSVIPPASYKTPQAKRKYQLENAQAKFEKLSTDINLAHVFIISILRQTDAEPTILFDMDERRLVGQLNELLTKERGTYWCAYNGFGFDFPILYLRGARYGYRRVRDEFEMRNRYGGENLLDPASKFRDFIPLDALGRGLHIQFDNPINGGQVRQCILEGRGDLVVRHATSRVTLLRDIDRMLRG